MFTPSFLFPSKLSEIHDFRNTFAFFLAYPYVVKGMKRSAVENQGEAKRLRTTPAPQLASYQDVIDALDHLKLTADQLVNLSKKIDELYSIQANQIIQNFPADMLHSILQTAQPPLHLSELLSLRTVSHSWNKVVCSFTRVPNRRLVGLNIPNLLKVFPRLRHLKLQAFADFDFSILTGITNLNIGSLHDYSQNLTEFRALTKLTKLTLNSVPRVTSVSELTSLTCLFLQYPFNVPKSDLMGLPHLTKLITDSTHRSHGLFDSGHVCFHGEKMRYDGEWKNGLYHGKGTLINRTGRYDCNFVDGKIEGFGVCYYWDADDFKGVPPWKVDLTGPNVDRYEGNWRNGKEFGFGKYFCGDGGFYEGEWDVEKHGEGTYHYPNGSKYVGQYDQGERHGEGVYYYPTGGRYEGQWHRHQRHGHGVCSFSDGSRYEGRWEDDYRWGHGVMVFPDGVKYEGEWKRDQRHGGGIEYAIDGGVKQGNWDSDIFIGEGKPDASEDESY